MTVSTNTSSVTAIGNGATTVWPFTFDIPTADDLVVTLTDRTTFLPTVLDPSVFSVTGLGTGSGSVTYPLSGSPIDSNHALTIARVVPYTQETDLVNQSGYYPDVVEGALDDLTYQTQQLAEEVSRAVLVPVGSGLDPTDYLETTEAAATAAAASATSAAASDTAAAAILAEIEGLVTDPLLSFPTEAAAAAASIVAPGYLRLLSYWSGVPSTSGLWSVSASEPAHAAKFQLANGNWAELAEIMPNITMFGCKGDASYDNYQKLTDALGFCSAKGIGGLLVPSGDFHFGTTLVMLDGVGLVGFGPAPIRGLTTGRNILRYTGTVRAIDAKAADDAHRVAFGIRDLSILGVPGIELTADAEGVRLGHNHRSFEMFYNVEIGYFGGNGILFDADDYLLGLTALNIHDCARHVADGAAIYKTASVADANAIVFTRLNIEGCGKTGVTAGAVNWQTSGGNYSKGLQFQGTISMEGNYGTDDVFVSQCTDFVFNGGYFEQSPIEVGSETRTAIETSGTIGTIQGVHFASDTGNTGSAMRLANSQIMVGPNHYDSRFAHDISAGDSSYVLYADIGNQPASAVRTDNYDASATFVNIGA